MSLLTRKYPRRIARELALLSLSQLNSEAEKLEDKTLNDLVLSAISTLKEEIHEVLEAASAEVQRGSDRLLSSETRAHNVESAKVMIEDALTLTLSAINRLGAAIELPEFIQLSEQQEIRQYTLDLIGTVYRRNDYIEQKIEEVLVKWQFNRLSKIDRDILKIAVAEILFMDIPKKVAINEAIELAKRYSDEEGHKFINGVLRKVTDQMKIKEEK